MAIDRLAGHYPAMVLHLESIAHDISDRGLWEGGNQLGDWLDPDAPPEDPGAAKADPSVVATACLFRSASFAAEAADILGIEADAARWRALADRTRAAFQEHYVSAEGRITSDCATVYALAIKFGLLKDPLLGRAGDRLVEIVRDSGYRVTTGFARHALRHSGAVADGPPRRRLPPAPGTRRSFVAVPGHDGGDNHQGALGLHAARRNHQHRRDDQLQPYALGAVVDWIYQVIGGIRPAAPGYAAVLIHPQPGPGITWARTEYNSVNGRIECHWQLKGGQFRVDVTVPDGIPAEIVLPDGRTNDRRRRQSPPLGCRSEVAERRCFGRVMSVHAP